MFKSELAFYICLLLFFLILRYALKWLSHFNIFKKFFDMLEQKHLDEIFIDCFLVIAYLIIAFLVPFSEAFQAQIQDGIYFWMGIILLDILENFIENVYRKHKK